MTNGPQNINGVVVGLVKEIDEHNASIKVEFPWLQPPQPSHWAPVATLMSGKDRGVYYMPELDDEVLIAFEHGKFDHPYVVGFLWNGADLPPGGDQHLRLIKSVNGHQIALYDPPASAGDKGFITGPGEDRHADVRVGVHLVPRLAHPLHHRRGQRVPALGTVHGEHEHRPVALHEEVLVDRCLGHGFVSRRTHMAKYWAAPP